MNRDAAVILLNLILLGIRMAPVFICLKPKYGSHENIAAASVYLWVIMIAAQTLFHIPETAFLIFQGIFTALFFVVLMIFFEGSALLKVFLYISAWFMSELLTALDTFLGTVFRQPSRLSYEDICLILAAIMFVLYYLLIKNWMKNKIIRLFDHMAARDSVLILATPCSFLILLFFGSRTVFNEEQLMAGDVSGSVYYLVFCLMMLILYMLMISDMLRLIDQRQSEAMLKAAYQVSEIQRESYDRIQDYQKTIRIIRHDFRHHIHALQHMDDKERAAYLKNMQDELDVATELFYTSEPAINSLLQEYSSRARAEDIHFEAQIGLGPERPVDNLTLCVILGNLLQNALEACRKCGEDSERFIRVQMKSEDRALRLMVENSFDGRVRRRDDRLLSTKKDGGLGMLSISRLLDQPGDDFDYDYNEKTFTTMIYLAERN